MLCVVTSTARSASPRCFRPLVNDLLAKDTPFRDEDEA
jgi:hypothetical protein